MECANLWVFLLLILYIICEKFCHQKQLAIYFPHFEYINPINRDSLLKFFIIFFSLLAMCNPYTKKQITQTNKGDAIVLAIDSSGSMAEYGKFHIVQEVASDFIDKRKMDKLGLVVFGTDAFIASPLTKNRDFIKTILHKMYVGVAGRNTAIVDSLVQSTRLLRKSSAKSKIVILLTDGVDNSSKVELDNIIKLLKKEHIKVYTIGVGDGVNYGFLKYISSQTGAKMFEAYTAKDIKNIYNLIDKLEKTELKNRIFYKEYYYIYPLGVAFLLLIIYIGRRRW